jgi:hypothetical protein
MDRVGAAGSGRLEDGLAVEVAAREPHGLVGVGHEGSISIGVDVDGDAAEAHVPGAPHDPPGDLAPVRNQQRREAHSRNTP